MNRYSSNRYFLILIISFLLLPALILLQGCGNKERADGPASGISDRNYDGDEWHHYGNDPGGMRFSPLNQINTDNVSNLEVAWKYETGELDLGLEEGEFQASFSATPLVVEGIMYFTTPSSRVIALDAETGRELWTFDPQDKRMIKMSTDSLEELQECLLKLFRLEADREELQVTEFDISVLLRNLCENMNHT